MRKSILILLLILPFSTVFAGTYGRITVPTQKAPYCAFMPFWYDGDGKKFSELRHPITVEKEVTITVTSPKYFRTDWLGLNSLEGLNIIFKNTIIKPVKLSEAKYQYTLKALPRGDVYAFSGNLKHPSQGLNICVE